jgi:uncharacterized membrane protein YagU involved in acid resistance
MELLKNSYVMAILTFIVCYYLFYIFGIGYRSKQGKTKEVKEMSIKFPLLFAFCIWLLWHFILFPHPNVKHVGGSNEQGLNILHNMWL